jgi:hypothetical protein
VVVEPSNEIEQVILGPRDTGHAHHLKDAPAALR